MQERISFDDLPRAVNQLSEKLNAIQQMLAQRIELETPPIQDELLSVQETASFLRLTVATVYSKVARGELPVMKQGNRLYFSLSELMAFLKTGKKKSTSEINAEAQAYLSNRKLKKSESNGK